jgi:hypothetical protein
MADFIEHIKRPEQILNEIRRVLKSEGRVIISSGNIALWLYRIFLLLGCFPYAKKGILDETHVHLYTLSTLSQRIRKAGFKILKRRSTPIPFELILDNRLGKFVTYLYYGLVLVWKRLFAYQFLLICGKESITEREREGLR